MGIFSSRHEGERKLAVSPEDIDRAWGHVRTVLPPTPLTHSIPLSEIAGREVFIKWDNKQRTGSFKERGAVNFLASFDSSKMAGVCAASAGNHALALSYHAARAGIGCHIVMPVNAPLVKIQATRRTGAEVILHGDTFDEAYDQAQELGRRHNYAFVSAFDNAAVIAGQGTCGMEIMEQLAEFDSVIVPVGGGGLISGIATAVKHRYPETFILGVQSEWAIQARQKSAAPAPGPRLNPVSIADGIAVKRMGELTKPLIEQYVDKLVPASESEIAGAIIKILELERTVAEGAGAAGVAALLANHLPERCRRVVVLVCGSNIDMNMLSRLIERDMALRSRILKVLVAVPDRPGSLHATTGVIAREGGNVLEVLHDRSFSSIPGNVDISFMIEVRDEEHKGKIITALEAIGISVLKLTH